MKYSKITFLLLSYLSFVSLAQAITFSGTAIRPTLGNNGSALASNQLALFVVDTAGDGFSSIQAGDLLTEGNLLGSDDFILKTSSSSISIGQTIVPFTSFSFNLNINNIGANDAFAVYFFDGIDSSATTATAGSFYGLATDSTWTIPFFNAATLDFNPTADEDSFQQLSNLQANNLVVPEPSAYAALAGLLALGFATFRRRR
jgi:hypothetical protein